jgi:hypothetical protein
MLKWILYTVDMRVLTGLNRINWPVIANTEIDFSIPQIVGNLVTVQVSDCLKGLSYVNLLAECYIYFQTLRT